MSNFLFRSSRYWTYCYCQVRNKVHILWHSLAAEWRTRIFGFLVWGHDRRTCNVISRTLSKHSVLTGDAIPFNYDVNLKVEDVDYCRRMSIVERHRKTSQVYCNDQLLKESIVALDGKLTHCIVQKVMKDRTELWVLRVK